MPPSDRKRFESRANEQLALGRKSRSEHSCAFAHDEKISEHILSHVDTRESMRKNAMPRFSSWKQAFHDEQETATATAAADFQ